MLTDCNLLATGSRKAEYLAMSRSATMNTGFVAALCNWNAAFLVVLFPSLDRSSKASTMAW